MINFHDTTFWDLYQGLQNENPRTMRKLRAGEKFLKGDLPDATPAGMSMKKLCVSK